MSLTPSPGYSITIRVQIQNRPGSLGRLTTAIGRIGGDIGAVDIVHVGHDVLTRDITVDAASVAHGEQIVAADCARSTASRWSTSRTARF